VNRYKAVNQLAFKKPMNAELVWPKRLLNFYLTLFLTLTRVSAKHTQKKWYVVVSTKETDLADRQDHRTGQNKYITTRIHSPQRCLSSKHKLPKYEGRRFH